MKERKYLSKAFLDGQVKFHEKLLREKDKKSLYGPYSDDFYKSGAVSSVVKNFPYGLHIDFLKENAKYAESVIWYNKILTEEELMVIIDSIHFEENASYNKISYFIERCMDRNVKNIYSKAIFEKYTDDIPWNYLSKLKDIPNWIIHNYKDYINWSSLSRWNNLSDKKLHAYKDHIDWKAFTKYNSITEEQFFEYCNLIDVDYLLYRSVYWIRKENRSERLQLWMEMNGYE